MSAVGKCVSFRGFQYISSRRGNTFLGHKDTFLELSLTVQLVHW